MAVKIIEEKCVGCTACIDQCPVSALEMKNDKAVVDEGACVDCGACVGACPSEAIEL